MEIKKNIANFVTSIRLLGAIAIIFLKPLELSFFIVYSFCGLSDSVDGFIARKLKITSEFGAKLDSVADLTFYSVMMIKLMPKLFEQLWGFNWAFVIIILIVRISAYAVSAVRFHRFSSLHTILNKMTSIGVFAVPYLILLPTTAFNIYGLCVCIIAFCGSLQELVYYCKKEKVK
ncbi:MAG: CDP-alcohol phosphatidyltransferase family protein [Clostridia bacterium]|nr:CDP-alcohol phosphatidyltransferase family protein [Clostridia bacterium]